MKPHALWGPVKIAGIKQQSSSDTPLICPNICFPPVSALQSHFFHWGTSPPKFLEDGGGGGWGVVFVFWP